MVAPNKQDSNTVGTYYAEEASLGTLIGSPIWRRVEPNSFGDFGGDVKTVARAPINPNRQRKKGTLVDLDASANFEHDFVMTGLMRLMQSFFFAAAREKADTASLDAVAIAIASATTTTYTAAAGLGDFKAKDIVLGSGFTNAGNNGIHVLSAATSTVLTTTGLTAEASPPAAARVQTVGVEFASADCNISAVSATSATLSNTTYDFTTLGLTPGEWIYVGGDTAGKKFVNNQGYARVYSIAAHAIVLDQTTWTPVNETGTAITLQVFFGKVLRNETGASILRKSFQLERQLGIGTDGTTVQAEYVTGAVGNELTLTVPAADKMTVSLGFVGIGSEQRTNTDGPKTGTRVEPAAETAINTSSDVVRSRIAVVDPTAMNNTPLVGYIQDAKITIKNGVTPNKAVGRTGAFDVSAGDFEAGGSLTAYFSDLAAVNSVRTVADVGYNLIAARGNQGFVWDMPLLTMGGGRVNVQKDQPITLPIEEMGAENALGYTLLYTSFPYLPTAAMPT